MISSNNLREYLVYTFEYDNIIASGKDNKLQVKVFM